MGQLLTECYDARVSGRVPHTGCHICRSIDALRGIGRKLLFTIQTSGSWEKVVIGAALLHAALIFWEPLTWREAWGPAGAAAAVSPQGSTSTCPPSSRAPADAPAGYVAGRSGLEGGGARDGAWGTAATATAWCEVLCLAVYLLDVVMKALWVQAQAPEVQDTADGNRDGLSRGILADVIMLKKRQASICFSSEDSSEESEVNERLRMSLAGRMRDLSQHPAVSHLKTHAPLENKDQKVRRKEAELLLRRTSPVERRCLARARAADRWLQGVVVLFMLDFAGYYTGLVPLRFARPLRLMLMGAKLREVWFLLSFLPSMCARIATQFSGPLFGFLSCYSVVLVRLYGQLPEEEQMQLGEQSGVFSQMLPTYRVLFMLVTLDNFDPVVVQCFRHHPSALLLFFFFVVFAGFYMMSMVLGVVGDLFAEATNLDLSDADEVEQRAMQKAYQLMDLEGRGKLGWREFKEIIAHLRPGQQNLQQMRALFHILCQDTVGNSETGAFCAEDLPKLSALSAACFFDDPHKHGARSLDFLSWDRFNQYILVSDAFILCCGLDVMQLPWTPFAHVRVDIGSGLLAASILHFAYLAFLDADLLVEVNSHPWRRFDHLLLFAGAACQLLYILAIHSALPAPIPQVLNAISSSRALRIALHHKASRNYLAVFFTKVGPMLKDFGALVLIVIYLLAVIAMELVGSQPGGAVPATSVPGFNSFGAAMMSIFLVFMENWQDVLIMSDTRHAPDSVMGVVISTYFCFCYIVLGIGLCNLLTSLIVDLMKVSISPGPPAHSQHVQQHVQQHVHSLTLPPVVIIPPLLNNTPAHHRARAGAARRCGAGEEGGAAEQV